MNVYTLENIRCPVGAFTLSVEDRALEEGSIYSVVGPNGSGKSTLLNLLALHTPPARSGKMVFRGSRVDFSDGPRLLALRRRIGYLMQNPYLFTMNIADNIGYGLRVRGLPNEEIRQRVQRIMEKLSIAHLAHRSARQLSGGEVQRIALARTLVLNPDVVLLDEPTANVDRPNMHAVEKAILEICRDRNTTVILTTHSLDQAYRMSPNLLSIINGRIHGIAYENVFEGPVRRHPDRNQSVAVADGVEFQIGRQKVKNRAMIALGPEDVLVSRARLTSSALNVFQGTITRVDAADGFLRIYVDIGVSLCATLTHKSFEELGLNAGQRVWVTFKASAIKTI